VNRLAGISKGGVLYVRPSSKDRMSVERIQPLLTFITLETLQLKHSILADARKSR